MIHIRLTPSQLMVGALVGSMRQLKAIDRPNAHGLSDDDDGWGKHIEGACGEIAAAQATHRYWPASVNTFKTEPDVEGFDVRTRSKHTWDLLLREVDDISRVYVLVTGRAPEFIVRGWAHGVEAKSPQYIQTYGNRPPAYFYPQQKLHPLACLPAL
jgi:hypothetical protein